MLLYHNFDQTSNRAYFRASGKFRKEASFYSRTPRNLHFQESLLISTERAPTQHQGTLLQHSAAPRVDNKLVGFLLLTGQSNPCWENRMMKHISNFKQGPDSYFLCNSFWFSPHGKAAKGTLGKQNIPATGSQEPNATGYVCKSCQEHNACCKTWLP